MVTPWSLTAMMNRRRRRAAEVQVAPRRGPSLVSRQPSRAVPWRWRLKLPGTIFFALLICGVYRLWISCLCVCFVLSDAKYVF